MGEILEFIRDLMDEILPSWLTEIGRTVPDLICTSFVKVGDVFQNTVTWTLTKLIDLAVDVQGLLIDSLV